MDYLLWFSIGYLSGSLPFGYLLGRLKGIDLTQIGSGSTGATNVLRNLGNGFALLTLVFDIAKGFMPVYLALKFRNNEFVILFCAISCILGHSKSIFLKFKGGKSSATGLGILIAICWQAAVITSLIWTIVVITSRYSSLGSIIVIPLTPLWLFLFHKPMIYIVLTIFAAVYIVLIRHRENIQRLIKGTELKIGQ